MHKNRQECVTPIEARSQGKIIENRKLVTSTLNNINKMVYFYVACAVRVTIFIIGSKFRLVMNFT